MAQEQELTLEQALAKLKEQDAKIADLEGTVVESDKLVGELTQELSNVQTSAELSPVVVVTHEKNQYRVICVKFKHTNGKEYAAADLSKHPEVIKELLELDSELLQLVDKTAKANASK